MLRHRYKAASRLHENPKSKISLLGFSFIKMETRPLGRYANERRFRLGTEVRLRVRHHVLVGQGNGAKRKPPLGVGTTS